MSNPHIIHDHPLLVFFGGIAFLIILQHDRTRFVAALVTLLIVVVAGAEIVGVDLKF